MSIEFDVSFLFFLLNLNKHDKYIHLQRYKSYVQNSFNIIISLKS